MRKLLLAVLTTATVCSTAFGWSDAGHKIVASIAFRQLSPQEQAKIAAILKQHPRFEQDFKSKMPEGLGVNPFGAADS